MGGMRQGGNEYTINPHKNTSECGLCWV